MSDVNVNIRGKDYGVGDKLDSLRSKAKGLGKDISDLNRMSGMSLTEKVQSVKSSEREQTRKIRKEFEEIRRANNREFSQAKEDFWSGRINKDDFEAQKKRFQDANRSLAREEKSELLQVEKDSANLLRLIYKEITDQERTGREKAQRDEKEFNQNKNSGLLGRIAAENRRLRAEQAATDDEEEIAVLQRRIDANSASMRKLRGTDSESNYSGFETGAISAAKGDLSGTIRGGIQGLSAMVGGKLGKGLGLAALTALIVEELLSHSGKIQEAIAPSAAMRGMGMTGAKTNRKYEEIITENSLIYYLGLTNEELANLANSKALASRKTGNLIPRTLDDLAFQRGFGADVGIFSQFERFTKGQENAVTIGLDVLNVLTSIQRSNLKEGDLASLSEKLDAQQTILSIQRQKRDVVDNNNALRVLSAFESIGLSSKGEKEKDFLAQTIEGLGMGGGDNAMLLKYEAARRARPDLANNPAALRRFVKYHSDDPIYIKEALRFFGEISGGNEVAMDDILYTLFPNLNERGMEIYKKAMRGEGDFNALLEGKGLESMKERKITLNKDTMKEDAASAVKAITKAMNAFGNYIQKITLNPDAVISLKDLLTELKNSSNKTYKVEVQNPGSTGKKYIPGNNTRTGK